MYILSMLLCNFDSEMTLSTYTPINCILAETLFHTLAYNCYVFDIFIIFSRCFVVCIPLISTEEVEWLLIFTYNLECVCIMFLLAFATLFFLHIINFAIVYFYKANPLGTLMKILLRRTGVSTTSHLSKTKHLLSLHVFEISLVSGIRTL